MCKFGVIKYRYREKDRFCKFFRYGPPSARTLVGPCVERMGLSVVLRSMMMVQMRAFLTVLLMYAVCGFSYRGSFLRMSSTPENFAVIGAAGSSAETIACRLSELGNSVTVVLDKRPVSPTLLSSGGKDSTSLYYTVDDRDELASVVPGVLPPATLNNVLSNKIVIAMGDAGDAELRGDGDGDDGFGRKTNKAPSAALPLLNKVLKALPESTKAVILSISLSEDEDSMNNPLSKLTGSASSQTFRTWCENNNKPFSLFRYGTLSGGVAGMEPLPFVGMPTLEPELDPTYALQSVILTKPFGSLNTISSDLCTRKSLAETIVKSLELTESVEATIVSTEGSPLTEDDWKSSFRRLSSTGTSELLRMEFTSIIKFQAFSNWITSVWFPQALIDANAATILRGARPVRALSKEPGVVKLVWEDMKDDLSVTPAGSLLLTISQDPAVLSIKREQAGSLPGEVEMIDNLVVSMETMYRKGIVEAKSANE